jgi:type VI secretion system protein ImpB
MPESIQHKLDRVRPPRVQITYDVEIGGAIETRELPLVVGVLADLSGATAIDPPSPRDRKFVEIDRDNFDEVMAKIAPSVQVGQDKLTFKTLDDFTPRNVMAQVQSLKDLFDARSHLSDLISKIDGNDEGEAQLKQAAQQLGGYRPRAALGTGTAGNGNSNPALNAASTGNQPKSAATQPTQTDATDKTADKTVTPAPEVKKEGPDGK